MPHPISALLIAGFWLAWLWLALQLSSLDPPSGTVDLLVVLDGTLSRLAAAERIAAALPAAPQCLLICCPGQPVPAQALPELLHGFDTATQITALAQWLERQQRPQPPRHPDGSAATTARPYRTPQAAADAFRLQLLRATGSTGAWLAPNGPLANGPCGL